MDCRHPAFLDAEALVDDFRERREAVRRARRVRDDLMFGRIVLVVVHAEDDGDVGALRGRRDHHALGAGGDVLRRGVAVGEEPGRLEHHVDAEILPRQLRRILHRQHLELVAVDRDAVLFGFDACVQVSKHRVVLQQVGERMGVGEIVDGDEVNLAIAERRPHDVPADAAEPVDSYPDSHRMSSETNVSFYNSRSAMYFAYSLLTLLAFVVISPYFVYQAIRYNKYIGSVRQRLGFLPISFNFDGEASIWIHAVSVGEVLTARALSADLKARYPRLRLFVSTTTIAGQRVARRNLQHVDGVFYFPFDWAFIVRRTLNLVKPRLFIMTETEIWPNLLRVCRARGIRTILINGRISHRSYPRYRLVRPFFRRVLADVDRFCMQSDESARRLVSLGADQS